MVASKMTMELEHRFLSCQIMDSSCIVYPQFWLADVNEREMQLHLGMIKKVFGQPKQVETNLGKWERSRELLSAVALDRQLECF